MLRWIFSDTLKQGILLKSIDDFPKKAIKNSKLVNVNGYMQTRLVLCNDIELTIQNPNYMNFKNIQCIDDFVDIFYYVKKFIIGIYVKNVLT